MGRHCCKESQDMKYHKNKARKRITARKRNRQKLSEEHKERAQNQKKKEFGRKSSMVKNEEGAEDRKIPIFLISKEKKSFL